MSKESSRKLKLTPELMRRMIYKDLVDTNPKLVEKRLRIRKNELYKAALGELSEEEAKKLADRVFWWVKD